MATFFGEVLPVFSRAVDDDDEEEDPKEIVHAPSILRWAPKAREEMNSSATGCVKCAVLIIAIGPAATGFTKTYLLSQESEILGAICTGMNEKDVNTFSQQSHKDKTCFIHRLCRFPEVLVVQCNTQVTPEQAYSWTQQLFTTADMSHTYVCILGCSSATEYKSDNPTSELPTPFLRSLKSSSFHGKPPCPYLEQPNTVAGLPAQVMSYCQVHKIAAVLYMCYTDTIYLDAATMKAFTAILPYTPFRDFVVENPDAGKMLQDLVVLHTDDSYLYT